MLTLALQPRRNALLRGHDNLLDLLIRAQAPAQSGEAPPRKRLNLAIVIDRSGSMVGQPLEEAKACAIAMVRKLTPDDHVSIVSYDQSVEINVPSTRVQSPDAVCAMIAGIRDGGQTDLHAGWAAGAEQAALRKGEADISRILLLSDGCANHGLTDPTQISAHCKAMAQAGVTTSTYGLGLHFNEDLMTEMASAGGGNAYYGQTAKDLAEPFEQEFDLLQATCARFLSLVLEPMAGIAIEMGNDLQKIGGGWRLPDIAWDSEAWAVARIRVPAGLTMTDEGQALRLLTARLHWQSLDGATGLSEDMVLSLPSLPLQAFEALPDDALVVRRAAEVTFATLQREAAVAARNGDWGRVEQVMARARRTANDSPWLAEAMAGLERYARSRDRMRFSKEASYASRFSGIRLAEREEGAVYDVVAERSKRSFLRRKPEMGKDSRDDER